MYDMGPEKIVGCVTAIVPHFGEGGCMRADTWVRPYNGKNYATAIIPLPKVGRG